MKIDILIIGQGLAGTSLALELYKKKISFLIIDKGVEYGSSFVAAGLYNPVAYKRMTPSWNHTLLMQKLKLFYKDAEEILGGKYIHPMNSLKIFSSEQDRDSFLNRKENKLQEYTDGVIHYDLPGFKVPYGFLRFTDTGYVDVKSYLTDARNFFETKGLLRSEECILQDLFLNEEGVRYRDVDVGKVVFCTGHSGINEYWNHLPFKPVKGEVLLIEMKADIGNNILVKDGFLLPAGSNRFVLGSTYVWDDLSNDTTDEGLKNLQMKMEKFTTSEYAIIHRYAGIRPASHDRRPFVGWHPEYPQVGILNGLGSKGVYYAPYCAEVMAGSYLGQTEIPSEMDIKRIRVSK